MKIAIALDENLEPGFLANAAACIASGLFDGEKDLLGEKIEGAECTFIPITKIPILKYMVFTREGQSTTSYEEYIERVQGKKIDEVEIVGIGVLGENKLVDKFAGDLPLL